MIHPTAHVSPESVLADDVTVGPFTVIHAGVELGPGTTVGSHCVLGEPGPGGPQPLSIGAGATIRSHCVLYAGSTFAERLETGHHATIREGVQAGTNLRVGTHADLQGDCRIGEYVRCHSSVFVAKGSRLGDFAWLFPRVVLTDDPRPPSDELQAPVIEEYAVLGAGAVILPGRVVGAGAVVAAGSVVAVDVPAGALSVGVPARVSRSAAEIRMGDGSPAYPWRTRFHRGYPQDVIDRRLDA
ncbi:MAG: N-acetyltransferase [Solirubrobacterales bacterium]|nr:N-acetyltransferase [Solirubrobacterales bacterium]